MTRLKFEHQLGDMYKITNKKGEYIGYLDFYKPWKCWVLKPMYNCIFSADCMQEIVDYMNKLKQKG